MVQGNPGAAKRRKKAARKGVSIWFLLLLCVVLGSVAWGAGFAVQAGFNALVDMAVGDGDVGGTGRKVPSVPPPPAAPANLNQ